MIKKYFSIFMLSFVVLSNINCETYKHKVNPNISEDELVFILPLNLQIIKIDGEAYYNDSDKIYISPGKHTYTLKYVVGNLESSSYKDFVLNGKPGEFYILCTGHKFNINFVDFKFIVENPEKWVVFPFLMEKEGLETYQTNFDYDRIGIQKNICNPEISNNKLLE
jgi:hypothetical protein